jgi:hypothetical protein
VGTNNVCNHKLADFDYAGSMMKFVTKGSLSYNDKEVSTDMTFDATKDIEGKITLRGFKVGIATFVGEVNNHVIRDRCSQCYLSFYVLGCIKCHVG